MYSQKYTRSFSRTVTDNCPARPSLRKEFKEGLKLLPGTAKIHMTVDDFEIITENGKHLSADGTFGPQQFHGMMNTELSRYIFRGLCNALKESDSESFKQLTLMLKMVEKNIQTSIAEIGLQKSISKTTGGVSVRAGDFGETGGGGAGDFRKSGHCL